MLRSKTLFLTFIIFITLTAISNAKNNVAYVDLDLILSKSDSGKILFEELKKLESIKFKDLKLQEEILKKEEIKISSSKNIITNEEFNKDINEFKNKVKIYQNNRIKIIEDLKKKREQEILRFLKLINPLIEDIMNERKIEILFDKKNIFVAKSNIDITNIIIESVNKNVTNFSIEK
jgi:Skp family chaperone for outer membrane proteins